MLDALLGASNALEPHLGELATELASPAQIRPGIFVENSPVLLFRWRTAEGWPVESVSENVTQFGYASQEMLTGRVSIASIVHPDDLERVVREVTEYSKQGVDHFQQTFRIVTKDGDVRWTDAWVAIRRDNSGQITHYQGIILDITERKRVEDSLRVSEALYQSSIDALPQNVYRIDREGRITFGNKTYLGNLGMALDECRGKTAYDFFSKELADKYTADDRRVMQTGELFETTETHKSPISDEPTFVRVVKAPVRDSNGNIVGLQAIFWDVTAQMQAELALTKRATELEAVAQVSTAASTILNTKRLLQEVADLTKERFGLYHAHIYLLNEAGDTLTLAAGAAEVGQQMVAEGWSIPLEIEQSLVARAARGQQGVTINDVHQESGWLPNPLLPGTRSEMAVPMMAGQELLGVLDVQADETNRFSDDDVRIMTTLAAQVAVALENARLLQQTQAALNETEEQAQRLAQLGHMSAQLNLVRTEPDLFQVAGLQTPKIVPADWVSVALLTEAGDNLELLTLQGGAGAALTGASLSMEGTVLGTVVRENRLVNTPDTGNSDLVDVRQLTQEGILSTMSTPLVAGGQVIGTLNVGSTRPHVYNLRDEHMLRQVGSLLSSAIENRRLLKRTESVLDAVQESRELLRSVIDATPDWILVKDREHRFRLVNQGFANSLHLAPADIVGKNDIELGVPEEVVKGDSEKGIRGFWADDLEVMDKGQTKIIDAEPTVIDGKPAFLNTIKVPMRHANGEVLGCPGLYPKYHHAQADRRIVGQTGQ